MSLNPKEWINSVKYKNSKLLYNIKNISSYIAPDFLFKNRLAKITARIGNYDKEYIYDRVNYYNRLENFTPLPSDAGALADFKYRRKKGSSQTVYFFDSYSYIRLFPDNLKFTYEFGDLTVVPPYPKIVKSRPVANNINSVLLNLNKLRHFVFIEDKKRFADKKDMLVGRAAVWQPHRIRFWKKYFDHPLCDLGDVGKTKNPRWAKKFMGIAEHLDYKFILCLEGNDVATNLKWVMSSNSLAVMPSPRYETWFMEARLIPGVHYVEIKPDYSDLEERLKYYAARPDECQKIITAAQKWCAQFFDKKREDLISVLVLEKYFRMTGTEAF